MDGVEVVYGPLLLLSLFILYLGTPCRHHKLGSTPFSTLPFLCTFSFDNFKKSNSFGLNNVAKPHRLKNRKKKNLQSDLWFSKGISYIIWHRFPHEQPWKFNLPIDGEFHIEMILFKLTILSQTRFSFWELQGEIIAFSLTTLPTT